MEWFRWDSQQVSVVILIKSSILDVSLGSKYAYDFAHAYKTFSKYLNKT